ncbi:dihydroorotase [Methylobacillus rhizosphaerae]|uniref:Dihydroorotase n=1 Tax=Methylobacillus rhizosphaerae TaxID=551994 RepID=A0A238XXY8_9PROT|nr:dihydroorotase [Methylobacillus rhizosphaerae]SNR63777.1 dihydroorotase [Methylobacillus rhizosphaerae]
MSKVITITRPDDWHLHLRDGAALSAVLPDTVQRFGRAIVMPNLRPPVTNVELAAAYRERIVRVLPAGGSFDPLMTLYLTDRTSAEDIVRAKESGIVHGVKLYPAGATTNSDSGVTNLGHCVKALEAMEKHGIPLLVHAEVTDADIDVFDREKVFIDRNMVPLLERFQGLRVVFEHITTKDAADFVTQAPGRVAATITAHHLLMNRNAMFAGGMRPHHYCLPVLKREEHRESLVAAAISGSPKFFLGTDSAPHPKSAKEAACGCAGMYTAHAGIELYAEAFDAVGALDKLEGFSSFYGADFYGLPRNADQITLEKVEWNVPESLPFAGDELIPLRAGGVISWRLK